jgi:outer membrane protein assembly factor BamA
MSFDIFVRLIHAVVDSLSDNRQSTEISWVDYEAILPKTVLATGIHGSYLTKHDAAVYDLFSMGGFNSLRGFTENRFHGYFTGWSNLELRYLLSKTSRIHLFFDYGVFQYQDNQRDKSQYNLIGTGIGLRLKTAVGMLGIDYAIGYDSQQWTNPMNGMMHFGLETKF